MTDTPVKQKIIGFFDMQAGLDPDPVDSGFYVYMLEKTISIKGGLLF